MPGTRVPAEGMGTPESWELFVASAGAGGQQHPFVHIGHSYVTCFKWGLCVC